MLMHMCIMNVDFIEEEMRVCVCVCNVKQTTSFERFSKCKLALKVNL